MTFNDMPSETRGIIAGDKRSLLSPNDFKDVLDKIISNWIETQPFITTDTNQQFIDFGLSYITMTARVPISVLMFTKKSTDLFSFSSNGVVFFPPYRELGQITASKKASNEAEPNE